MKNAKSFTWLDYNSSYRETIESWFDSEAVKYTGCKQSRKRKAINKL